jgi:hypothetical protein
MKMGFPFEGNFETNAEASTETSVPKKKVEGGKRRKGIRNIALATAGSLLLGLSGANNADAFAYVRHDEQPTRTEFALSADFLAGMHESRQKEIQEKYELLQAALERVEELYKELPPENPDSRTRTHEVNKFIYEQILKKQGGAKAEFITNGVIFRVIVEGAEMGIMVRMDQELSDELLANMHKSVSEEDQKKCQMLETAIKIVQEKFDKINLEDNNVFKVILLKNAYGNILNKKSTHVRFISDENGKGVEFNTIVERMNKKIVIMIPDKSE